MSKNSFNDCRYVWLTVGDVSVSIKLDDEGVVVDAWQNDECVASTWKTYHDFGVEVKGIEDE